MQFYCFSGEYNNDMQCAYLIGKKESVGLVIVEKQSSDLIPITQNYYFLNNFLFKKGQILGASPKY